MATKSILDVEPSEISFMLSDKDPVAILTVTNRVNEKIAFKVKTTQPKRYLVKPNQEILDGNSSATVRIQLQGKEARALAEDAKNSSEPVDCKDKFLVQSISIDDDFYHSLEEKKALTDNNKSFSNALQDMWKNKSKDELSNKKLRCRFIFNSSSVAGLEETPAEEPISRASTPSKPAEGTPTSLGSSNAISDEKEAKSMIDLRKKYNDLVLFTVQLTAERDRYKQQYTDARKELSGMNKAGASADESQGDTLSAVQSSGTFSLWQMLLVAVMAFLLARLLS